MDSALASGASRTGSNPVRRTLKINFRVLLPRAGFFRRALRLTALSRIRSRADNSSVRRNSLCTFAEKILMRAPARTLKFYR